MVYPFLKNSSSTVVVLGNLKMHSDLLVEEKFNAFWLILNLNKIKLKIFIENLNSRCFHTEAAVHIQVVEHYANNLWETFSKELTGLPIPESVFNEVIGLKSEISLKTRLSQQTLNIDSTLIYVEITSRLRSTWYPRWFNVDLATLIRR